MTENVQPTEEQIKAAELQKAVSQQKSGEKSQYELLLMEVFTESDDKCKGLIYTSQLSEVLQRLGFNEEQKVYDQIALEINERQQNVITLENFLKYMLKRERMAIPNLTMEDMKVFSQDYQAGQKPSNLFNVKNFKHQMTKLQHKMNEADVNEIISELHLDQNKAFKYEELVKLLLHQEK